MPSDEDVLFGAVDALLEEVASREPLPAPPERKRLREAAGLSQEQVAGVLQVRREAVSGWEAGRTEPRAPKRAAYARLLEGLAARYPAEEMGPAAAAPDRAGSVPDGTQPARQPAAGPPPPDSARAAAVPPPARPAGSAAPVRSAAPRRTAEPETSARRASTAEAADSRFAHGPLGVLDGDGSVYCLGGLVLDCPARTLVEVVEWVLNESRFGAARLHRAGRDADPLIVLTAAAAERLGLPPALEDRRGLRLPQGHTVVKHIAKAGWKLTRRGFGPWARVYRPADGDRRQCVQFAVLPWDALDTRSWGDTARLPAPDLAAVLGTYAARVITPRGSTAVCGLELMTALRPPTRAVRDETSGTWVPGPVPGSLCDAVDPAPPEAPAEHPVVAGLYPRHHQRTPDQVIDEEAFDWIRAPELLTGAECARRFAVGIDVNTAFLAAANRLVVGLSAPVHVKKPAFDKKIPGAWLVDLSGIELDPRLPNPFTPHGERPPGPAWYATPTVAYAAELVATYGLPVSIEPAEAWLRPEAGPYLDPWYKRLSEAYRATMADLGVVAGMDEAEFLTAMATHRQADPGTAAVLSAIKATVKGGIGKLRERPQGAGYRAGERWPALERPTWRPDIRAAVISTARVNMHRKILKTALAAQRAAAPAGHLALGDDALVPVALLSDCAVYLSDGPSPRDVLPYTPDGSPAPGTFRLGVSPGMVKHEGTQDLLWAVRMLEEGHNPAQHIKGTDV
ncbi:telomere-associated protein Tap [Streptomyces pacificus]|uniref:Helix-turn-helix domain-containing protein n=1 Tax=Streptomyces pacificus TaxID=2705029 RepID=A0A6A0B286_9ACTN|nr:helix-turn-helix transcriptional regulator [Streptomyces pacificus]GFH39232.1 helix-turn-helix domain-containing protein [Streptomyces pacificus]